MSMCKKFLYALFFLGFMTMPAAAQSVNIDLGDTGGSSTARMVQLVLLLTVLSIEPCPCKFQVP